METCIEKTTTVAGQVTLSKKLSSNRLLLLDLDDNGSSVGTRSGSSLSSSRSDLVETVVAGITGKELVVIVLQVAVDIDGEQQTLVLVVGHGELLVLAELSVLLSLGVDDLALLRQSEHVVAVLVGELVVVPLHLGVHSAVLVEDGRVHGVLSGDTVDSENNGGLGVLLRDLSLSVSVSVVSVLSVVSSTSLLTVQGQLNRVVTRSVVDVDLVDLVISLVAPVVVPVLSVGGSGSGSRSAVVPSAIVPSTRVLDGAGEESLVVVEPQRNVIVVSVVSHVPSASLSVGHLHSAVVADRDVPVLVVRRLQSSVAVHEDVDGNEGLAISSNVLGLGTVVDVGSVSEQLLAEVVVLGGSLELVDEVAVGSILLGSGSSQAKSGSGKNSGGGEFHGRS